MIMKFHNSFPFVLLHAALGLLCYIVVMTVYVTFRGVDDDFVFWAVWLLVFSLALLALSVAGTKVTMTDDTITVKRPDNYVRSTLMYISKITKVTSHGTFFGRKVVFEDADGHKATAYPHNLNALADGLKKHGISIQLQ